MSGVDAQHGSNNNGQRTGSHKKTSHYDHTNHPLTQGSQHQSQQSPFASGPKKGGKHKDKSSRTGETDDQFTSSAQQQAITD